MSVLVITLIVINIIAQIVLWIIKKENTLSAILGWGLSLIYYILYWQAVGGGG